MWSPLPIFFSCLSQFSTFCIPLCILCSNNDPHKDTLLNSPGSVLHQEPISWDSMPGVVSQVSSSGSGSFSTFLLVTLLHKVKKRVLLFLHCIYLRYLKNMKLIGLKTRQNPGFIEVLVVGFFLSLVL